MPPIPERITVSGGGFSFPTTEILTGRGFITGKSGAGKSNTANVIAEELLELGLPFVIVDIDGEYWGLKESYSIERAGRGEDVDFELAFETVPELVDMVLEDTSPLILDLATVPEEDTDDLVEEFVRQLFDRENDVRKPCLLFVEELHEFLPQRGGHDDLASLLVRVAKRGRKRGLGVCGMSQRPAAVDKDFITQCDWIVWHRLTWENDVSVVSQILGAEAADDVQGLETGEALVMTDWDEELTRVHFRQKHTFDAGATPDLSSFADDDLTTRRQADDDAETDESDSSEDGGTSSRSTSSSRTSSRDRSSSTDRTTGGGATAATTDGGATAESAEFDPVQEVALLAAHGATVFVALMVGGVRRLRSVPALARRLAARRPASISLPGDHLGRPRDRLLSLAVVLLLLLGVVLLLLAAVVALTA